MRYIGTIGATLSIALLVSTSVKGAGEKISIAGSTTVHPIISAAIKEFQKIYPEIDFEVSGGGSGYGVKTVGSGEVQIGMASRELEDQEKASWKDLTSVKIGVDGIALVGHWTNPVTALTKQQVQDIYTGKITNWKEVGGTNSQITPLSQAEGHVTLEAFMKYFELEGQQTGEGTTKGRIHRKQGEPGYGQTAAQLFETNQQIMKVIAEKPTAIGYVSINTAQERLAQREKARLIELDGVSPTIENVTSGKYPLSRPLLLLTKGEPIGDLKNFISFLIGIDGQKIVADLEFIPIQDAAGEAIVKSHRHKVDPATSNIDKTHYQPTSAEVQ